MRTEMTIFTPDATLLPVALPALIGSAGERAAWRFLDFFTVTIHNPNTREAYLHAVSRFLAWCKGRGVRALLGVMVYQAFSSACV